MESVICVWNFCLQKNWGWKSRKTSLILPYASACKNALISGKVPGNIDVKTLSKPIEKKLETRYNYTRQKLVLLMQCNAVN